VAAVQRLAAARPSSAACARTTARGGVPRLRRSTRRRSAGAARPVQLGGGAAIAALRSERMAQSPCLVEPSSALAGSDVLGPDGGGARAPGAGVRRRGRLATALRRLRAVVRRQAGVVRGSRARRVSRPAGGGRRGAALAGG